MQKKRYNALFVTMVCYGPLLILAGGLIALVIR